MSPIQRDCLGVFHVLACGSLCLFCRWALLSRMDLSQRVSIPRSHFMFLAVACRSLGPRRFMPSAVSLAVEWQARGFIRVSLRRARVSSEAPSPAARRRAHSGSCTPHGARCARPCRRQWRDCTSPRSPHDSLLVASLHVLRHVSAAVKRLF